MELRISGLGLQKIFARVEHVTIFDAVRDQATSKQEIRFTS